MHVFVYTVGLLRTPKALVAGMGIACVKATGPCSW